MANSSRINEIELGKPPQHGIFSDAKRRRDFVFKVYSIVSVQILVSAIIISCLSIPEKSRQWSRDNIYLALVFLFVDLIVTLYLCIQVVRRTVPINFILLSIATISLAISVGIISAFYDPGVIALAAGITAIMTIALTILAIYGPDITRFYLIILILTIIVFILGIVLSMLRMFSASFETIKVWHLGVCCLTALLMSIYIVFDTQLILGDGQLALSEEEYISGAIRLYTDIINLFLQLLQILGNPKA